MAERQLGRDAIAKAGSGDDCCVSVEAPKGLAQDGGCGWKVGGSSVLHARYCEPSRSRQVAELHDQVAQIGTVDVEAVDGLGYLTAP